MRKKAFMMFMSQSNKPTGQEREPIDITSLRGAIRHRLDVEKKLLFILYETAQDDIQTLSDNINEETPGAWEHAAHGLKGAAANICVDKLSRLCEEAEDLPPESTAKRREILKAISSEFKIVLAYIQKLHPHFMEEYQHAKN